MSRAKSILRDTFPVVSGAAIAARRVVVFDATTKGNVKYPAATPEFTFAGVTINKQNTNQLEVECVVMGNAICESDGSAVINPGDYVIADGAQDGRVKSKALADGATVYNIIGICVDKAQIPATAASYVTVRLQPQVTPLT